MSGGKRLRKLPPDLPRLQATVLCVGFDADTIDRLDRYVALDRLGRASELVAGTYPGIRTVRAGMVRDLIKRGLVAEGAWDGLSRYATEADLVARPPTDQEAILGGEFSHIWIGAGAKPASPPSHDVAALFSFWPMQGSSREYLLSAKWKVLYRLVFDESGALRGIEQDSGWENAVTLRTQWWAPAKGDE